MVVFANCDYCLVHQLTYMVYEQTIRELFSQYNCEVVDVAIKQYKIDQVSALVGVVKMCNLFSDRDLISKVELDLFISP